MNKALRSRTIWTLVATALFNGLESINTLVPAEAQIWVNVALLILAGYFKLSPSQNYN